MTTVQERLGQIRGEMKAAVELGNAAWLDDLRREQYALWQREQDDAHDRDAGASGSRILDGARWASNRELAAFHAEHEELVASRPLLDAVARYGAALAVWHSIVADSSKSYPVAASRELTVAQRALDALALARATPHAEEG